MRSQRVLGARGRVYAADDVLPRMARALRARRRSALVWLRPRASCDPRRTWPEGSTGEVASEQPGASWARSCRRSPESDRAVAVRHQGELLGALSVRKRPGESLTPIEEKLLEDLANQAGAGAQERGPDGRAASSA